MQLFDEGLDCCLSSRILNAHVAINRGIFGALFNTRLTSFARHYGNADQDGSSQNNLYAF